MSTEVENATISYKQVCDKNGFCVVKIISETSEPQNLENSENLTTKETTKIEESKNIERLESTRKITSSRTKKKK